MTRSLRSVFACAVACLVASEAHAGPTITSWGNVIPLEHINQMAVIEGRANFDEGPTSGFIPLDTYQSQGLRFATGGFETILPGCTSQGTATNPSYTASYSFYFTPAPIGGGTQTAQQILNAGVATFSIPVTQVGVTAGENSGATNGFFLTAWDSSGHLIGQVRHEGNVPTPAQSSFVGIDTKGALIAMIAYGNDDVFNGTQYNTGGSPTIVSDSWVWGSGECSHGTVTAQGAVTALTDRRQMAVVQGTAAFDEGPTSGNVPLATYTATGLDFKTGDLNTILPGVDEPGTAVDPQYTQNGDFPSPICGRNDALLQRATGAVATFSGTVTQVGLTVSGDGVRYLTVWRANGDLLGQVKWEPSSGASFMGLDTGGVAIGMVAFGDDDVFGGATYSPAALAIADTWIWAGGCVTNADCDDDNDCNGLETCSAGVCADEAFVACTDLNGCTDDVCGTKVGCSNPDNDKACSDSDACTSGDVCVAGACTSGEALECDDYNECTDDSCDVATGCVFTTNASSCSDDDACTSGDACVDGDCIGEAVDCDDANVCTNDSCNETSGCKNVVVGDVACDDGNACTSDDSCASGTCDGVAINCDDADECTADGCGSDGACTHDPVGGCCHVDGDCGVEQVCDDMQCRSLPAAPPPEDDGCGCATPGSAGGSSRLAWLALAAAAVLLRRRVRLRLY